DVSNIMYFRPEVLTASKSRSASSSEPNTAGTAEATCFALQRLDAEPRVAGRIGGEVHRLDGVVLHQLLERRVGLRAPADPGQVRAAVGDEVAHRGHLDVGMVLEPERGAELADAVTGDADPDLPIGDGTPALRGLGILRRLLEPRDGPRRLLRPGASARPRGGSAETEGLQERASRGGMAHGGSPSFRVWPGT